MPRQTLPVEVSRFNAGLFTDANPLTSPPGTMLDAMNLELNIDGSIRRRFGMDYAFGNPSIATNTANANTVDTATTTFTWSNAGGDPATTLYCLQVGTNLTIFSMDDTSVTGSQVFAFSATDRSKPFSYAVVDGLLVVANNLPTPTVIQYDPIALTFTTKTVTIKIRDLFGVADTISGVDLYDGSNVVVRPTSLTDIHVYNLRNQTFGIPRLAPGTATTTSDPIDDFFTSTTNKYPSNSDNVISELFPDTSSSGNKTVDRFWADNLKLNPLGTDRAPQGYFIINALTRGVDRLINVQNNNLRYNSLAHSIINLPNDTTPGGPTVVCGYGGRMWYAGFSATLNDGDALSPRMSSYLLFSQLVDSVNDLGSCYQEGDPTSKDNNDIVDTDGGFIRINEAYNINYMVNLGDSLFVVAQNGVWRISGGVSNGFTATAYIVDKITDRGCVNTNSVVLVENALMYWGEDGIYVIKTDQFGGWGATNITFGHIQTLFNNVSVNDKKYVKGCYDSYEHKVKWLYNNQLGNTDPTIELVYDVTLQAFYTQSIASPSTDIQLFSLFAGQPYTTQITTNETNTKQIIYLVSKGFSSTMVFGLANYNNTDWMDFSLVDAPAYAVTNYMSQKYADSTYQPTNDFQRKKQIPYLTAYMENTDSGFTMNEDGDLVVIGGSSVIIQSMWEWTNSSNSGRWGRPFQAYRHRRLWLPSNPDDAFEDGYSVVVTRNKLRGSGKVVSLKFSTEAGKNFHLYGWSMLLGISVNV